VVEESSNPQFEGTVRLMNVLMGLTLAFKKKYGEEALKVTKNFVEEMGVSIGNQVKKDAEISGSDIKDIESALRAWQDSVILGPPPKSEIEGNKLIMKRKLPSKCPALQVAKQMNVPLETICKTVAFPMFRGVTKAVNPKAKHTSLKISREECVDVIEI